jgi:hypothetical protein
MKDFSPKRIGNKNTELEQKIVHTYHAIITAANDIMWHLDSWLGYVDKEKLDPSIFFGFMNSKDPKAFLYSKYIECHGISFPGISIAKVIELGLVDVPLANFSILLDDRITLLKIIQSTNELKFHFPLIKLWQYTLEMFDVIDLDENGSYTIISSEFESKLNQTTGRFTLTESDNAVLEAIEKTVDSLNGLVKLGVIGNDKGKWINGISKLANAIVFDKNSENPLSVNPRLNQLHEFRRFFSKTSFNPILENSTDMLQFDGLDTLLGQLPGFEETEESTEGIETEQTENNLQEVLQAE